VKPLGPGDTKIVRGATLRRDPARESRFTVAHDHAEMYSSRGMSVVERREKLHRDINNEVQSLEIAAQTLVDFPEAPWDLRMTLARQCWDEARHAWLFRQRLEANGGRLGEFPILNQEWGVVCALDSIAARLSVQNRAFEAGALDLFRQELSTWRAVDERTAEVMEAVLEDEIQHVRAGNEWLAVMTRNDPRVLLAVARAVDYLRRVVEALTPEPTEVGIDGMALGNARRSIQPSEDDRRAAAFTDSEIAVVKGAGVADTGAVK
jgi:hypothetical protein